MGQPIESPTPTTTPEAEKIPYPKDAGCFPIRHGDIVMTRAMYDFIMGTINILPSMPPQTLRKVCKQISEDMAELIK